MTDETVNVEVDEDDKIILEIEDDTPEEDKGKAKVDEVDGDEVGKYSEKVQKRIKRITFERHEERRGREEAERIRDQAVDFARGQHNELVRMRQTLARGEIDSVATANSGNEARLDSARSALKMANESGDSEAIAEAQEALAVAVNVKSQWDNYRPQYQLDQNDPKLRPLAPKAPRPKSPPPPTAEAAEWAEENNEWFNKDEKLTAYAFGVHKELITSGVVPDSSDYYKKLDAEMAVVLSKKKPAARDQFDPAPQRRATVVASSSRTEGTPRKVHLTQSQVALANRLGITPEAYAKELIKQEKI